MSISGANAQPGLTDHRSARVTERKSGRDANKSQQQSATEVSGLEVRCARGEPCPELTDRLVAADRSAVDGFPEIADVLRRAAARYAELHNYGQGGIDEDGCS
jgi:hypothetical protein